MSIESLKVAVESAGGAGRILVATAGADGKPHVAAASTAEPLDGARLLVTAWLCPRTLANLETRRAVALVVWGGPGAGPGHQLVGEVEAIEEGRVLDGSVPGEESVPIPQFEFRLRVRVDEVLEFTESPHTDREA